MAGNNQFTARQFIEAIEGTGRFAEPKTHTGCMGIISTVARRVGCNWHTAKKYCTRGRTPFVTVAVAFENEAETALDMAESKLLKMIQESDGPMIRYFLSTKGKNRGFTERQEITGKDGGPVEQISYNVTLSDEQRSHAITQLLDRFSEKPDRPIPETGDSPVAAAARAAA